MYIDDNKSFWVIYISKKLRKKKKLKIMQPFRKITSFSLSIHKNYVLCIIYFFENNYFSLEQRCWQTFSRVFWYDAQNINKNSHQLVK